MSYDYANQTNLIPQQLYSETLDASQSIKIDNQGIVLGGDLLTTPIYASISQNGISTTNPNGFDILSKLNMNSNNITNVGTITATSFNGTASNANNVTISDNNTGSTFYPTFASTNSGNLPLYVDKTTSPLSYVPFTGNLTATTFTGSLSGNATTATTASQVVITSESGNTNFDICMTSGTSGNLAIGDTSTLYFNPSTLTLTNSGGIISATTFNGTTFNGSVANASTVSSNSAGGLTINGGSAQALIINSNASSQPINLQQNGTTQSSITSTGVQQTLLTTQGTATYSSSTLTFVSTASAPYPTYYNNIITFSGSTTAQSVSTITPPTNMPVGSCYTCYITNSNTSAGAITFNPSSLGTGIKTTYTGGVTIPINGFGLATLTKVGSSTYIFSINLVA